MYTAVEKSRNELSVFLIDSLKQKQKSYAQYCLERNIGGAILQGLRTDNPYYKELIDTNISYVIVDIMSEMNNGLIGNVSIDNAKASKEIAVYFIERNYRDIVIMAETRETFVNTERIKGVQEAFKENEMFLPEDDVLYAQFSEQEAYILAGKVFAI